MFSLEKREGKKPFGRARIILNSISEKLTEREWFRLVWLRIGARGRV
jgi:hypothetical protein